MEARLGLPPRPFLYMGDEPPHLFSGHTVLPEPDFHRLDRASFAWRTRTDSQLHTPNFSTVPEREEVEKLGCQLQSAH